MASNLAQPECGLEWCYRFRKNWERWEQKLKGVEDLHMPRLSGLACLRRYRNQPSAFIISLYMSSAYHHGQWNYIWLLNDEGEIYWSLLVGKFAIDSTLKLYVESSSRFLQFWKANPCGNYDIDLMWKFRRGFHFQNPRNIDEISTWIFLRCFDVEST